MIDVATRFTYSDTPKATIKHASRKARRRQDIEEVRDSLLASIDEVTFTPAIPKPVTPPRVAATVFVWDDGLDYNIDGTSYQDSPPGDFPHSYHHSRKDAEVMAAYLENSGCEPWRITIVEDYLPPEWDAGRIPPR